MIDRATCWFTHLFFPSFFLFYLLCTVHCVRLKRGGWLKFNECQLSFINKVNHHSFGKVSVKVISKIGFSGYFQSGYSMYVCTYVRLSYLDLLYGWTTLSLMQIYPWTVKLLFLTTLCQIHFKWASFLFFKKSTPS